MNASDIFQAANLKNHQKFKNLITINATPQWNVGTASVFKSITCYFHFLISIDGQIFENCFVKVAEACGNFQTAPKSIRDQKAISVPIRTHILLFRCVT